MHYEVSGTGKPLLLVHGLFSDMGIWRTVVEELFSSFRVISYDLRGHGTTGKGRPEDYSIPLFSEDVAGLLDMLGIGSVFLVGHSAGGAIACQFTATHPERVSSLVLVGAPSKAPPGLRTGLFLARFLGVPRTLRLNASRFFYPVTKAKIEAMKQDYEKAGKTATLAAAKALSTYELPTQMSSASSIPTLLVYGDRDGNLDQGREISQEISGSKLVTVPETGHWLPVDNPRELSRLIREFCSGPE